MNAFRSGALRKSMATRLLAVAAATVLSTNVFAAGQITGAGSTWVYPLVAKWAATYAQQTGVQVNYQPIGSGGGIQQIKAGTVAFGASDMPLTPDVLSQNQLIQFPTAIAGEDIVYNLPGVASGQLLLTGPVIADIYLGKITQWNDPAIQKLNPSLHLPDMAISVMHRSDGSGHDLHVRGLPLQGEPGVEARRSARTPRSTGRSVSAARAIRAWPATCSAFRARSATWNTRTSSRTT